MKRLEKKLSNKEGKKSQVSIGNIRELLALLADEAHRDPIGLLTTLYRAGKRRAAKRG